MADDASKTSSGKPQEHVEEGVPAFSREQFLSMSPFNKQLFQLEDAEPDVTLDNLIEMRKRDGQARALIQLIVLPLRYALQNGTWESPEGVDPKDSREEVDLINNMWNLPKYSGGMSQPKSKVIRQMLLSMVDGFSPFEVVTEYCKVDGPLKGKYRLKKLAYRDPRTIKIMVDSTGGYAGFRQVTQKPGGGYLDKHFDIDQTLVITNNDEINPYYGVSYFESAYPHWDTKRKLYYISTLAAQFAAVPGRVGTVPLSATVQEISAFREALANFAFNTAMVHKEGFNVDHFNGNSNFDFIKLIDHHNTMMSKSILAAFFDQENRTVIVDASNEDASADLFLMSLETVANDIASALSEYLMPKYIDWNIGSGVYPRFVPAKLSDSIKQMITDFAKTLAVSSVINFTPEFVRETEKQLAKRMDLSIDYDDIEKREKEAAEQQAQAEAEQNALNAEQAIGGLDPNNPNPQQQPDPNNPNQNPKAENVGPPGSGSGGMSKTGVGAAGNQQQGGVGGQQKAPNKLSMSNNSIDDLVEMAQALFMRPEYADEDAAVDEGF